MKKKIFIIFLITLGLSSCRSTRDMKLFQNLGDHELNKVVVKPPEYRIKPDDNLYINVQSSNPDVDLLFSPSKSSMYGTQSNYGDLTGQYLNGYQVDSKGMIYLPLIGEVHVADKTEEEAKLEVQKKVEEYYKGTTVTIKVLTFKISILGEVRNPGVYHNYNKYINILEAISLANGISDVASLHSVLVLRSTPNGSKSYRLDLTKKDVLSSEAFYLLPNDIVYIEPDKYKNFGLNSSVYSMALSAITTAILILTYVKIK
ncbi:MAG: polysaccharide biosynthesis/export family protein [Bacteroidota bacterium]|nr:polysaccharide biosynthesis/export family protein [Bacteroidota bacterium]